MEKLIDNKSRRQTNFQTDLPSVSTLLTVNKGCHRFVCTSCLDLKSMRQSLSYLLLLILHRAGCLTRDWDSGFSRSSTMEQNFHNILHMNCVNLSGCKYSVSFDIFRIWKDLLVFLPLLPFEHRQSLLWWISVAMFWFHHLPFPFERRKVVSDEERRWTTITSLVKISAYKGACYRKTVGNQMLLLPLPSS